jgi:predicted dehydrogenase
MALEWVKAHFPEQRDTCYQHLDEALRSTNADAAIITSAPALRADQALQALEARVAVAIEQPLALSLVRAAELMQAARRHGQPIMVAQTSRHTGCTPARGQSCACHGSLSQDALGPLSTRLRDRDVGGNGA